MAPPGYVTCQPLNTTSMEPTDLGKDDLNALLYIVVTLLFYSMGIIIGIITYLKREQAEMEEDKLFDLYLSFKREPFTLYKQERVQQMAIYLKQVEEARIAREKIEIWNAEQQIRNSKSCGADMSHGEQSSCTSAQPHRVAFGKDGAPLVGPEPDIAESGGASALLCSLTYGVCEPLLTPEGTKSRLSYPGRPVLVSPPTRTQIHRHSAPSLNSMRVSKSTDTDDNISSDDVLSTHLSDLHLAKKSTDVGFRDSKIELQDLGLFNYNLARAVFQKTESKSSDNSKTSCENPLSPERSIPSPEVEPPDYIALRRSSTLKRQLSLDAERKIPSPDSLQNEHSPFIVPSNPDIEEELPDNLLQYRPDSPGPFNTQLYHSSNTASFLREPHLNREVKLSEKDPILHTSSMPKQSQYSDNKTQTSTTADVRPKVYDSFLRSTPTISSHTKDPLPAEKKRLRSPYYDSWRKGAAHTVDIPDIRAFHGPETSSERRKNNDKRLIPRPQTRDNERRGALLITQKSLHHIENDGPKTGVMKKGALLKRQESADSYTSRNTEQSDVAESPLRRTTLQPCTLQADTDSGLHLKHQRKAPRLARSQTVDATKTHNL